MRPKRHSKRWKGKLVRYDGTTEDENSPTYQESNVAAPNLLVMMVTTQMTLVVVLPHFPHKEEVMRDLSLPSQLIN
jgi:hypothetical protein